MSCSQIRLFDTCLHVSWTACQLGSACSCCANPPPPFFLRCYLRTSCTRTFADAVRWSLSGRTISPTLRAPSVTTPCPPRTSTLSLSRLATRCGLIQTDSILLRNRQDEVNIDIILHRYIRRFLCGSDQNSGAWRGGRCPRVSRAYLRRYQHRTAFDWSVDCLLVCVRACIRVRACTSLNFLYIIFCLMLFI